MARRSLVVAVALVLATWSVGSSLPTQAGPPTKARTVIDPRPLGTPGGISVRDHFLYVVQPGIDALSRVDLLTGDTTMLASDRDSDAEELVTPDDLWVDPMTGDVYVTELVVNSVRKISPNGTRTRILVGFGDGNQFLNGVELDAITGLRRPGESLRLFVSTFSLEPDKKTGIYEIDPNGVVPPRLVYGAVAGVDVIGHGLTGPDSMAFDRQGEKLFVSELHGGKVWAIDVDRHTARQVYDPGLEKPIPFAVVTTEPGGTLLYGEHPTGRILRLRQDGLPDQKPKVVATVEPGVHNITVGPDGTAFVSGLASPAIVAIRPNGTTYDAVPGRLNLPNGIAPLPDGRILVGDWGSVALVDPRRGGPERLARPWRFLIDDFDLSWGVATTDACTAYASGIQRGSLQRLDICNPSVGSVQVLPPHTFGLPGDLVARGSEVWVTDLPGTVWHVTGLDGASPTVSRLAAFFDIPSALALKQDELYVSETGAGRVRVVDPGTGENKDQISGLNQPEGLAFEADGSLLVVEAGLGRLTRIRPDGTRETVLEGLATDIRGVLIPGFNYFADVTVTPDGEIVVSSPEDGSLRLIA